MPLIPTRHDAAHPTDRLIAAALLGTLACVGCNDAHRTPFQPSANQQPAEWREYGGQNAARYSPLDDIAPHNVRQLEVAWTHRSGDYSEGDENWTYTSLQVTPLMADGTLFYCTPFGRVFALDAETGAERWVFEPAVQNRHSGLYPAVCRGVSLWSDPAADATQSSLCDSRILYGTRDAELIALDSRTGVPCPDFGQAGRVALKEGIAGAEPWEYYPTSPPYIAGDLAVVGAMVPDNDRVDAPSGVVRAFDVRSGALAWAWEPVTEDYLARHADERGNARYHLGTPNVWAPISGDPQLGLVFIPTGNPSPDLFGGQRDGIDTYGSSVVALDAHTGAYRWHFQTVHHDIWDYDVAAQPTLFQLPEVGDGQPGLAVGTKMGHVFLLDRDTGNPLYPVEERPVPQEPVAGETLSPTQPFPTHPAPLHLPQKLGADDMDGFVLFDKRACRETLAQYRNDGIFTPPTLQGSVTYPATTGGINWGGVTVDPQRKLLFVNQMHLAAVVQLIPRDDYDALNPETGYPLEYYPMTGTPYGVKRFPLFSSLGAPCNPRPWGSLTAVDLVSGEVLWRKALGNTRGQAPWPFWFDAGTPNMGGSLATGSGVLFIGATTDGYFRAFDSATGEVLWRHRLPFTGNATPLSYRARPGGRQFVVIAAGGHGWSDKGDAIVAFALPEPGE